LKTKGTKGMNKRRQKLTKCQKEFLCNRKYITEEDCFLYICPYRMLSIKIYAGDLYCKHLKKLDWICLKSLISRCENCKSCK
jgi:hypothetical protein